MRFILDANISWRLIKIIEPEFGVVIHAKELPISQPASDINIWNYAKLHKYTIITLDNDFHDLALINQSLPKIIHLRLKKESNAIISSKLIENKEKIYKFLVEEEKFIYEIY